MSVRFADVSGQVLRVEPAVVTTTPFTMACWFRSEDAAASDTLMFLGDGTTAQYHALQSAGSIANDPVRVATQGAGFTSADSSTGYTVNTWHHACGIWRTSADRSAYIDGGSRGNGTGDQTPSSIARTSIGRNDHNAPFGHLPGRIAEAAVWDVGLTDREVAALGRGTCPLMVRPESLAAYWPIWGITYLEDFSRGQNHLTMLGSPVTAPHAPVGPPFASDLAWGSLASSVVDGPATTVQQFATQGGRW